jgi:hypothetical protein
MSSKQSNQSTNHWRRTTKSCSLVAKSCSLVETHHVVIFWNFFQNFLILKKKTTFRALVLVLLYIYIFSFFSYNHSKCTVNECVWSHDFVNQFFFLK